jgi:hypothetical protein
MAFLMKYPYDLVLAATLLLLALSCLAKLAIG